MVASSSPVGGSGTLQFDGIRCNTPVLTLFALNVYDVYIVINHGVELKAKASPWIIVLCFGD